MLFDRYFRRKDPERFEDERRFQLYDAFTKLLSPKYLYRWDNDDSKNGDEFRIAVLERIRKDAVDESPDMWVEYRLDLYMKAASRAVSEGNFEEGISKIEVAVNLLEKTMAITGESTLPTSCRFLDGMRWIAKENWHTRRNNPDAPRERNISIYTEMKNMSSGFGVYPSDYFNMLKGKAFESIRDRDDFKVLCDRVKKLIITQPNE